MLDSPFDLIAYVKKYFQQKSTRYKNSEKKVSYFVVGQVFSPFESIKMFARLENFCPIYLKMC